MAINLANRTTCKSCNKPLDCNSVQYCRYHLLKERGYDMRRRNGGLNPYNLKENVKTNKNKLGIEIIGEA